MYDQSLKVIPSVLQCRQFKFVSLRVGGSLLIASISGIEKEEITHSFQVFSFYGNQKILVTSRDVGPNYRLVNLASDDVLHCLAFITMQYFA